MDEDMKQEIIGVVGAGVMGIDVAITFAARNYRVVLMDISEEICAEVHGILKKKIRSYKMISELLKNYNSSQIISNIKIVNTYEELNEVDWIIENITEDEELKSNFYEKMDGIAKKSVRYAVNTSCISITKLGQKVTNPENIIGMHFMNPVPLKECVEVIKGYYTSEETIEKAGELLYSVDKNMVVVNDSPGFVANRLSHLFMNEAAFLVLEQVAEPKDIDKIFKSGYGHKMGPLETADLIGLDTVVNSLNVLYESYQDDKFRCCPLLKKMVAAGLLGKKSGQGFYKY